MKKGPFHETVKALIFGKDEKELGKLGLARNNEYRIFAGLYMVKTTNIPEKEIPEMIEFLNRVINHFDNPEIKSFTQEIIEEISIEEISKK